MKLTIQKALNLWRFYPFPVTDHKILPTLSKIISIISYGLVSCQFNIIG